MTTTSETHTYPAHALKGGDVLPDGRIVLDTLRVNRRELEVRTTDVDGDDLQSFVAGTHEIVDVLA